MLEYTVSASNQEAFDAQLDDEAFKLYTGVSIARARNLCLEENLDFDDEFAEPFKNYISKMTLTPRCSSFKEFCISAETELQQDIEDGDFDGEPIDINQVLNHRYFEYLSKG